MMKFSCAVADLWVSAGDSRGGFAEGIFECDGREQWEDRLGDSGYMGGW